MVRWRCVLSIVVLAALALSACQPVMPVAEEVHVGKPTAVAEEEAPEEAAPLVTGPARVLLIGGPIIDFNYGVNAHLAGLARVGDPPVTIETESMTGDVSLDEHWERANTLRKLEEGDWDVVVLHENLAERADENDGREAYAAVEEVFLDYACRFSEAAAKIGAKTVIMVPWEYLVESYVSVDDFVRLVEKAAAQCGAEVAPVGQAWKRVLEVRPDAAIHEPDRFPSIRGTYLTAAVLYAMLLGRNPADVDYSPASMVPDLPTTKALRRQYDEIPAEDLAFLGQMAWETVQEHQAGE